ncbi:hypothetical protein C3L33_07130, partial [Rhododendron williamsianum]
QKYRGQRYHFVLELTSFHTLKRYSPLPMFYITIFPPFLKVDKGGEDAFFVSSYNGGVIAVADGVSGYRSSFFIVFRWLLSMTDRLDMI